MIRKIMAVIITLTLFLGLLTPVGYGDVKSSILSKVEAENLVREKLSLDKDYKLQYGNLHTRDAQQRQFWNLEFLNENKGNTSVVISADSGEIISINSWSNDDYGKAVVLLQDEAKEVALNFIKFLEPKRFSETEEVTFKAPSIIPYDIKMNYTDNDNYHFMFVRKMSGEFFPNNYFRITISGVSGNITSYEMKWDNAIYERNKDLLDEKKARDLFEKEDRLNLKYINLNKYNKDNASKVVLTPVYIYAQKETDKIDAITGRLLSFDELYNWHYYGYPIYGRDVASENEMMDKEAIGGVVEMIPEEGVISKEKAEQIVLNMLKDNIDISEIKLNSTNYTNYYSGIKGKFWSMYWHSLEGNKYLNSVINAENGQVLQISYNKHIEYMPLPNRESLAVEKKTKENIVNNDDTLTLSKQNIQKLFPKTKGELKLEIKSENNSDENYINITSFRYINNIPFEDNYVNIRYNSETNEISSLNYRWYDVEVQNKGSMIDKVKAHKIFYDKVGFEKYLVQLKDLDKYKNDGLDLPKKELLLVYGLKSFNFRYIDALTGKFLDYSGEEYKEEKVDLNAFNDLKGSPYRRDIMLMDKMGILKVTEENLNPKQALLRKDALKWIIEIGYSNKAYNIDRYYDLYNENKTKDYFKDISKDDPYYKYIEVGVRFGIIEEGDYFNPDEKISKIELTKWIINAMKQQELAKYSSIFNSPYKDKDKIKAEDTGYVALAKYYNIFGDKNIEGEFNPSKNPNNGEFIQFMYRFIKDYKNTNR